MSLNSNALITLDEFKSFKGFQSDVEIHDEHVEAHINTVSQLIENYCNRIICPVTSVEEKFSGDGLDDYYVANGMIVGTPTLYYYNGTGWTEMDTSTYPRDVTESTGLVELTEGGSFSEGKKNYKISYSTGWTIGNVPFPIKGACFIEVQRLMIAAENKEGVSSESFGDQTTSFDLNVLSNKVKNLLNPYRRMSVA